MARRAKQQQPRRGSVRFGPPPKYEPGARGGKVIKAERAMREQLRTTRGKGFSRVQVVSVTSRGSRATSRAETDQTDPRLRP